MRLRYLLIPAALVLAVVAGTAGSPPAGGSIEGKVNYTGTPPKMKPIDMSKEPTCAKEYNPPLQTQNVVTGPGSALEHVVVYISAGEPPSPKPWLLLPLVARPPHGAPRPAHRAPRPAERSPVRSPERIRQRLHPLRSSHAPPSPSPPLRMRRCSLRSCC